MAHQIDSIIRVSANIAAAQSVDSASNVDMPEDGEIVSIDGIIFSQASVTTAALQALQAELSFLSTSQLDVNDARGSLMELATSWIIVGATAGAKTDHSRTLSLASPIPVFAGERIHLHTYSNLANLSGRATFTLYMQLKGGGRRSPKRR